MKTVNDIVVDLIALTEENRLQWSRSREHTDGYAIHIAPDFDFAVWLSWDSAINENGVTAELRQQGTLIDTTTADRFDTHFPALKRLHDAVRRSANGVDASINKFLHALAGMKR